MYFDLYSCTRLCEPLLLQCWLFARQPEKGQPPCLSYQKVTIATAVKGAAAPSPRGPEP